MEAVGAVEGGHGVRGLSAAVSVSRPVRAPFVVREATGCAIRTRLKDLTDRDVEVLRAVGAHLGSLASRDLRVYARAGFERNSESWAVRKQALTGACSSRWAGAITKGTHDQYALARRAQAAHLHQLETTITTIRTRLDQPIGAKGSKHAPGGYRSAREWRFKAQRLRALEARHAEVRTDWEVGRVRVVRGGKRLANTRHHLDEAGLTEQEWRARWQAVRAFLSADGESGKRFGNETIRVTPDGEVSVRLPKPLEYLANAPHGRYVLTGRVAFAHRGEEWADRIEANRAVAYEIRHDPVSDRWYLTASWKRPAVQTIPLEAARAGGVIGVDMNADHLAAYRLDPHGNPMGDPRRFDYDLTGTANHRDAQLRHALTRLMHWAVRSGVGAVAIEDLDFSDSTTREKHGRRKKLRQTISGIPTARLKARIVNMAAAHGLTIVAVDPAYTSKWGAQHWKQPLTTPSRAMTRHDAAAIAIGRRALGHPVRRRTATPPHDRSDRAGHRAVQAPPGARGREETRPSIPGQRTRSVPPDLRVKAGDQRAQHRSEHAAEHESWTQDSLPLSLFKRTVGGGLRGYGPDMGSDQNQTSANSSSGGGLPEPATAAGRDGLDAILAVPERAVIALDFDGTLAPIVPDPDRARAHPDAVPALAALAPKVAAVAVVTGRPAEVAVRNGGFAGVAGLDHLVVLGHYGAERWEAATGKVTAPDPHPGVEAVRREFPEVLASVPQSRGTWIEDKGRALAAHTRRAEDPEAAFEALREPLDALAERHGLIVEPGRMVLELRPPGIDKGVALRAYLRDVGAGAVLYAGDDLGDIPAFDAVDALRGEGLPGVLVCSANEEVRELASRADVVVPDPEGVVRLLAALAARLG